MKVWLHGDEKSFLYEINLPCSLIVTAHAIELHNDNLLHDGSSPRVVHVQSDGKTPPQADQPPWTDIGEHPHYH